MIEAKDIVGWVVMLLVAAGGWCFAAYKEKSAREEKKKQRETEQRDNKIEKIKEYLDALSELQGLYSFLARKEEYLLTENGSYLLTESGNRIVMEETQLEPEPRFEDAIRALEKTDIKGAIAQKTVQIRIMSGVVLDVACELDSSQELRRQLVVVTEKTTSGIDFFVDHRSFDGLREALKDATKARRDLREKLHSFAP